MKSYPLCYSSIFLRIFFSESALIYLDLYLDLDFDSDEDEEDESDDPEELESLLDSEEYESRLLLLDRLLLLQS